MDNADRFFRAIMNKAAGQTSELRVEALRGPDLADGLFKFAEWFKTDYMTWLPEVPQCVRCLVPMELTVYGFDSGYRFVPDASQWTGYKRVSMSGMMTCRKIERYVCLKCHDVRITSRENDPLILIKTREGRCGEHAILFAAFCLALDMRARLVVFKDDDHVTTEVLSAENLWVPVDPSVRDTDRIAHDPGLFKRRGWKLTNVIAYEPYQDPVDVSETYGRA